jgi:hypothetical protein
MWHILRQLVPAGAASSLERMRAGIELLLTLRDGGALFLAEHPQVLNVLNTVQRQLAAGDRSGLENLAHNALAEAYGTSLVDEVAAELAPAGLTFCGTADLFLNDPDLCLPDSVRVAHDQLGSRLQKELLRDFMRSSAGRRDVFSRRPGGDDGSLWLTRRAQATLTLPREAARQQLATPAWTAFRYTSPEIEFVFERLADGATSLQEVALDSVYTPENLSDAYLKLVACPGIEPCIRRPAEVRSGLQRRLAPGSPFNALALRAAGAGPVQLASPVLGSCIELPGPAGRVVAGLCGCGPDPNLEALDPASRQWLLREQLPLLVRLGVLTAE